MFKLLFPIIVIFFSMEAIAKTDHLFREGAMIHIAPPAVNEDYFLLEYGYIIPKKIKRWDYSYNAYINASLFEDWSRKSDTLRGGALGFKGGAFFPLGGRSLFLKAGVGFAKTVLHENPLFGKEEQIAAKKDMFALEAGAAYLFDQNFLAFTYQISNVSYFKRNTFFSIGINY